MRELQHDIPDTLASLLRDISMLGMCRRCHAVGASWLVLGYGMRKWGFHHLAQELGSHRPNICHCVG